MTDFHTIIIGSGMTGLSCGVRLAEAGIKATIFDKGRGIGGRMATRVSPEGLEFDHGAQYFKAKDDDFQRFVEEARGANAVSNWDDGSGEQRLVGTPRMNSFPAKLGEGLSVRQGINITQVYRDEDSWSVHTDDDVFDAENVVITIPAPQISALIGIDHPLSERLSAVKMAPCITLMAAFSGGQSADRRDIVLSDEDLVWIANNSSKPGRTASDCWVAQASPFWSEARIDLPVNETGKEMLSMLCSKIGFDPLDVKYVEVHRWKYANVSEPLGEPLLKDLTNSLFLGGDWCLAPRVEAAWLSGRAIALAIINKGCPEV